jgi:heat shock protein HtpX
MGTTNTNVSHFWESFSILTDVAECYEFISGKVHMNTLKTAFFMTVLTLLLVFAGQALGGRSGMVIAFGMAVVMNFGAYWFSDRMVLAMYRAQEVSERDALELHSMVRELSMRAGLPMPRVYIIENYTPNAFATGRNPKHAAVAVTTGILEILNRDELMGVLAHELAHIKNRDILIGTVAATFAGAISMLASMAQWGAILGGGSSDDEDGGGNIITTLIFSIIASIAATLIQLAISRSREYLADESGARLAGEPRHLANALYKLHHGVERFPMQANPATAHMFIMNPLTGGGVMRLFSTHPPIEERIERLSRLAG